MAGIALGVISNRALLLKENLPKYEQCIKRDSAGDWVFIIRDDESSFSEVERIKEMLQSNGFKALHVSSSRARAACEILNAHVGNDVSPIFSENYGGLRNFVLVFAAALQRNLVFVDDDTSPLYDFAQRYVRLFNEGWQLIPGGYEGQTNVSAPGALYEFCSLVRDARAGLVSKEKLTEAADGVAHGISSRMGSYSKNMFVGGNLGISLSLLKHVPYFPTHLRIEDALYKKFVEHLTSNEKNAIFTPSDYSEAYAKVPLVQHERKRSAKPVLCDLLINELKGSVLAKVVLNIGFDELCKCNGISDKDIVEMEESAVEETWEEFNMKNNQETLREGFHLLEGDAAREAERIILLDKDVANLPLEELRKTLELFSFTLSIWPQIIDTLGKKEVWKEVERLVE